MVVSLGVMFLPPKILRRRVRVGESWTDVAVVVLTERSQLVESALLLPKKLSRRLKSGKRLTFPAVEAFSLDDDTLCLSSSLFLSALLPKKLNRRGFLSCLL